MNTQNAAAEQLRTSSATLGEQGSEEPSTPTARFEDCDTSQTLIHSATTGPSTRTRQPYRSTFSTKAQTFLSIPGDDGDHWNLRKCVMNRRETFSTTTTYATTSSREDNGTKQEPETAKDTIANSGEQEVPLPRFDRYTISGGAASVDRAAIADQVRQAMRTVPQSVCIITSTDISTGTPVFRGATISSFNSVTMQPTTIVSLNIKRPSSTFDAMKSSGYFIVHLLKAGQITSNIAQAFTKGNSTDPFRTLKVSQFHLPETSGKAAVGGAGPPLIEDCPSPGRLLCRYMPSKTVQLGDHVVIFGTVDEVTKTLNDVDASQVICLAYANGQFGRICPLQFSSAPEISRAAFNDFISKVESMEHGCLRLRTMTASHAHLDLLPPVLKESFSMLRSRGEDLFHFLTHDETFNSSKARNFETQPNTAHARARAAIMQTYRENIMPFWVKSAAKSAEYLQNTSKAFEGLSEGLMSWLRQYCEICKETAQQLHSYKAFLLTSGLQKYYNTRDEVRPSLTRRRSSRISNAFPPKRSGRSSLRSTMEAKKRPLWRVRSTFSVRKHLTEITRFVETDKPSGIVRIERRDRRQPLAVRMTRIESSDDTRVSRTDPGQCLPGEAGPKRKARFLDADARLVKEAERQEEEIQRGLEDLRKLMAETVGKGSKS